MTFDEALAQLGVAKGATADEIRRAYLRLLKTRKPETDPEGFRTLRDAYECARAPRVDIEMRVSLPRPKSVVVAPDEVADVLRLANGGRPKAAARALSQLYEKAAIDIRTKVPPARFTLDLLVDLHARGATRRARRLASRFERWLTACGNSRGTLGPLVPMWILLIELTAVCEQLSEPTRVAIVRMISDRDAQLAKTTLDELRERDPVTAHLDLEVLRALAPSIHRAVGVRQYVAPRQKPTDPRVTVAVIVGMLLIFAVIGTRTLQDEARERERARALEQEADADYDGGLRE